MSGTARYSRTPVKPTEETHPSDPDRSTPRPPRTHREADDVATDWITWDEAVEITGCPRATLYRHVQDGRIVHRGARVWRGSLERTSVERFAQWLRAQRVQREQARLQGDADRAARRALDGPPIDGDVWFDTYTAHVVTGLSRQYLGRLADQERVPAVRRGRRWWFRRSDIEQLAASRAFAARSR